MKSGLEDRNNVRSWDDLLRVSRVSMKSGLEDRNNLDMAALHTRLESSQ